ncbi:hypothetical protein CBOM_07553 [Ceraceosorus bombacis]|uniref:Uncharacterized protein n=1 Tax=Ceraceosorus bombacis TaxID=401625 RepID=A0A0N7L9R9_9BASI|nr:hypothetical protein CBOM_07553 [Ceraceosorus bombacis]
MAFAPFVSCKDPATEHCPRPAWLIWEGATRLRNHTAREASASFPLSLGVSAGATPRNAPYRSEAWYASLSSALFPTPFPLAFLRQAQAQAFWGREKSGGGDGGYDAVALRPPSKQHRWMGTSSHARSKGQLRDSRLSL